MTDFEKIIKITRYAKKDAQHIAEQRVTLIIAFISVVDVVFSHKVISAMFSGRKEIIAHAWYHTVYCLRLGRDVN